MPFVSEVETSFATGSLKWNRTIAENDRDVRVVFSAEFREKQLYEPVYLVDSSVLLGCSFVSGPTAVHR